MEKIKGFLEKYFTPPRETTSRTNNFNAMRLVASLMVIYGHMSAIMGQPQFMVMNQKVSSIGVKIFFILSGYFITKSYLNDSNFLRYTVRRVFRIYPAFIAVVLFSVFVVGGAFTTLTPKEYFTNPETYGYFNNLLMNVRYSLPGVFTDYTYPAAVNGSLWSLPVEFSLYFILPLFIVIFKKLKCIKGGIFAVVLVSLGLDLYVASSDIPLRFVVWGSNLPDWITLITFFFIGSLLSFPEFKKIFNLQLSVALIISASLISLTYPQSELLLAIVLPYFVLSFGLAEKPIFGNWFSKNDYSYGLYLYGFVIQQVLYNYLKPYNLGLNLMTVICFAAIFICAFISWHLIEKPAGKLAKKILIKLS